MQWIASAAFGLEGLVKRDLLRMGAGRVRVLPSGGVGFEGGAEDGFRANLWLRTADRVLLEVGRFKAVSFDELFRGVGALPWEEYMPPDAAFPVRAQCARSRLMSPGDCQSIVKKSIVERLRRAHGVSLLPETGPAFQVDVAIHEDEVCVSLDSTGPALSRRGYRTWNGEAPLRETLAAALALNSPWRPDMPLYDPCCGTGTILIEAAFIALDRACGLTRDFAMENWPMLDGALAGRIRGEAQARFEEGIKRPLRIAGSDIDGQALELARRHIRQAGLPGRIALSQADLRNITPAGGPGVILTNPPYGERLGDRRAAQAVARALGGLSARCPDWTVCVLTADRGFERAFGRRADKRRRLYNGRLECEFMTFYPAPGARPEKDDGGYTRYSKKGWAQK